VTINLRDNKLEVHDSFAEPWNITLVDTGLNTMTGGRIKRVKQHIGDETFLLTYGDGVSNVNIRDSVEYHKQSGKLCTVTAVQPSGRFGALNFGEQDKVTSFTEKPKGDGAWINGGFFVCEPAVIDYIQDDTTIWEREPLEHIAADNQMQAYKHHGFWKPMDTLRDKFELDSEWQQGVAKWKTW
jgi:glucose-1-phosphate cytidylyltransferase